ncbi:MAG: hypothetical protein FJX56_07355 [Alphaproteobacteria bacterium]|nr:hypothetical protein [Alphaproteobacteria bacterium]
MWFNGYMATPGTVKAHEEREKYDEWVKRGDRVPLDPAINGSWYFARWDADFRKPPLAAG